MNGSERGDENLESINERSEAGIDKAGGKTNGEAAGGERDDVPGGAYNVPRDLADEVGEEDAKRD